MYAESTRPPSRIFSRFGKGNARFAIADHRTQAVSQRELIHTIQKSVRPHPVAYPKAPLRQTGKQSGVAQRLCGFEAELNVPTMQKNGLDGFLEGGMDYPTPLGGNTLFDMTTDHGPFHRLHREGVEAVNAQKGGEPPPFKTISNLEYVTKPVDEFSPHSDETFIHQFEAIQQHAQELFKFVHTQTGAIPGTLCFTGLPVAELTAILGAAASPFLESYRKFIKPEFYIQATVGIIPSSLGDLWKEEKDKDFLFPATRKNARTLVDDLLKQPAFQEGKLDFSKIEIDPESKSPLPDKVKDLPKEDYDALTGVLYMIASYVIGKMAYEAALLEGSTRKNLVPFMLKTGWEHLEVPVLSSDLILDIALYFSQQVGKDELSEFFFFTVGSAGSSHPSLSKIQLNVFSFVTDVLSGTPGIRTLARTRSSRMFPEPDPMPDEIGQPGIQVEYRHITEHPKLENLSAVLMEIVKDVRSMNAKYVKPKESSASPQ